MPIHTLKEQINNIDIYLLDQILKERYLHGEKILDAGCGGGRNLKWFCKNSYEVFGVDTDHEKIEMIKERYGPSYTNFLVASITQLPLEDNSFHHIICNAVLHFAKNTTQFLDMFLELIRVLKPKGSIFIRMASNIGIENSIKPIGDGVFQLPDETVRFLLTPSILEALLLTHNLEFIEPLKTTNVANLRTMSTLMLTKL